jgi:predicted dehydrogenase
LPTTEPTHADNRGRGSGAVSVGLVGLGYWGPNLLRVLVDDPAVQLRWICDRREDRLKQLAPRCPDARCTTSYEELLQDPALDAVMFATPVHTHFELASHALRAGKHTFVEKPLASSVDEADELLRHAESEQLVLMCGHTFIYSPPVRAVKALLDRGELGDIHFISSTRVNLGLHQSDVSVISDLGPHDFSILRYWLDEMPEAVTAVGRDAVVDGIPDVAFVTLRYGSGMLVNLEMSWLAPSKLRRTVLVGSEKMVLYDDGAAEPVRIFDHGVVYDDPKSFGEYQLSYRTGDILSPKIDGAEPLALQVSHFAESVGEGALLNGHGELSRDVVVLVEAAEASLQAHGQPIEVGDGRSDRVPA